MLLEMVEEPPSMTFIAEPKAMIIVTSSRITCCICSKEHKIRRGQKIVCDCGTVYCYLIVM